MKFKIRTSVTYLMLTRNKFKQQKCKHSNKETGIRSEDSFNKFSSCWKLYFIVIMRLHQLCITDRFFTYVMVSHLPKDTQFMFIDWLNLGMFYTSYSSITIDVFIINASLLEWIVRELRKRRRSNNYVSTRSVICT